MPVYGYYCAICFYPFERRVSVEHRDCPQVCDRCGNGANRYFVPSMVNVPEGFAAVNRSDLDMTLDQCREQEKKNDAYLASKPKSKPTFEEHLKKELDAVGYRHPHKLIDHAV